MRLLFVLPSLLLAACAYVPADYKAQPVDGDPKPIVERIMREQPHDQRPQVVRVTDSFVEYGRGLETVGPDGQVSIQKKRTQRLYYSSIDEVKLLNRVSPKGHWYVVEPRASTGRTLAQVYVDQREDAEKLADALLALKAAAPVE